ncbi:hypothetical protein C9994_08465 [Marivirga lumbricoides]|uniref:Uncharacterized protein n=2 Tax=Marivirga lumbricoides TaxID=1046115 RepID=A0A2T4DQV2_9BACT|nr:hypothetical protein C9994_08465 [Marivirga lumbricoides]
METFIIIVVALFFLVWMIYQLACLEQIKDQNKAQTAILKEQSKVLKLISFKLGKNELDQAEGISIKDRED